MLVLHHTLAVQASTMCLEVQTHMPFVAVLLAVAVAHGFAACGTRSLPLLQCHLNIPWHRSHANDIDHMGPTHSIMMSASMTIFGNDEW